MHSSLSQHSTSIPRAGAVSAQARHNLFHARGHHSVAPSSSPQFQFTMAREGYSVLTCTVVVLLLVCRYSSAQGCYPTPPTLMGGPPGTLGNGNVPNIATSGSPTFFRVAVGGHTADPWSVFSETQVMQHGLWCQVQESNTNNMADNNIGDWYYPTPSGLLALDNINNDGTPYQELKCDNQVGLVVDGDIMNNQGIVRCTSIVTGLTSLSGVSIDANYFGVYKNSVITTIRNCECYLAIMVFIGLMNSVEI